MEVPFTLIFVLALIVNVGITVFSSDWYKQYVKKNTNAGSITTTPSDDHVQRTAWRSLLQKYLFVYLLATTADWLQGPYVYALYDEYGYKQSDIAVLFVAGFGSSMVFGSFVGGMADKGGRRTFVALYAVTYALSCLTKHFPNFYILMIGRLLGGIATSLLFSVFDAWLIRAHADANLDSQWLSQSFAWASYGNSVIAIVSGLLANQVANANTLHSVLGSSFHMGGKLNPFDVAFLALLVCGGAAVVLWEENYGTDENANALEGDSSYHNDKADKWYDGLKNAYYTTLRKPEIWLCGAISSLFEGSMYIFVFMWTPLLQGSIKASASSSLSPDKLPFGLIFSTFMVCCMAGSSWFSVQVASYKLEVMGVYVLGVAAAAMAVVALATPNATMQFLAMLLFEGTVGLYFPIMGTLKGAIVPEDKRAAIYNLFRIPLNFIVLFSLLTSLSPTTSFALNAIMLGTATVLMKKLRDLRLAQAIVGEGEEDVKDLLLPKDETV